MKRRYLSFAVTLFLGAAIVAAMAAGSRGAYVVQANNTYQTLPYSQNWTSNNQITTDNDWSGVPGIIGYSGANNSTDVEDIDPRTILTDPPDSAVMVRANHTSPNSLTDSAVAEFHSQDGDTNPMAGLRAQTLYDFPYLLFHLDTTGYVSVTISYDLVDIDSTANNAASQVALHYRVGDSGNFTNLDDGYVADATQGPSVKGQVTNVSVTLPAGANNQPMVQFRIMTSNADGADEWIGIDNISVTGTKGGNGEPTPTDAGPTPTVNPDLTPSVFMPTILR